MYYGRNWRCYSLFLFSMWSWSLVLQKSRPSITILQYIQYLACTYHFSYWLTRSWTPSLRLLLSIVIPICKTFFHFDSVGNSFSTETMYQQRLYQNLYPVIVHIAHAIGALSIWSIYICIPSTIQHCHIKSSKPKHRKSTWKTKLKNKEINLLLPCLENSAHEMGSPAPCQYRASSISGHNPVPIGIPICTNKNTESTYCLHHNVIIKKPINTKREVMHQYTLYTVYFIYIYPRSSVIVYINELQYVQMETSTTWLITLLVTSPTSTRQAKKGLRLSVHL